MSIQRQKPDLATIGRVLKLEWELTDEQVGAVLLAFFGGTC